MAGRKVKAERGDDVLPLRRRVILKRVRLAARMEARHMRRHANELGLTVDELRRQAQG